MKIIKHGVYFDKYRVFKCPHCECVFELEDVDLKDYDFDFVTADTLWECPECHSRIGHPIGETLEEFIKKLPTTIWMLDTEE